MTSRCTPFSTEEAVGQIEAAADALVADGGRLVAIGGDHTIALPILRATARRHGPLALVHFDAHLDTWDTYFGQRFTHGTPFRRAWEEGLLLMTTASTSAYVDRPTPRPTCVDDLAIELHPDGVLGPHDLPRIAEHDPVVGMLHLVAVHKLLLEQAEFVVDPVADGRIVVGGERVEESRRPGGPRPPLPSPMSSSASRRTGNPAPAIARGAASS